ncbi:carbohydrate ABC transporter permease [Texcoconibacillus texcoconensis]|uniref:Multiple sugar transport system permease protein n=1 Tax=Texcoconibacillus texcoconensis TaxID=1095777 RepID=A0A840QR12_9BACI|nr:sugar ABC transporter permease [Texcoconibacillus texcoconensis]MBB5173892.1 multiple sugar transport system permease protein [Texcoconibacillus texcoconensis]
MKTVANTNTGVKSKSQSYYNKSKRFWKKESVKEIGAAYFLMAPFILIAGIFIFFPILYSLIISFQDFSYLNPDAAEWVGFNNYVALLQDSTFINAIKNTVMLLAIVVPIQTMIALILAAVLNSKIRARTFFRTVYYLPYITSPIAVGAVMVYMFNRDGVMTQFMTLFGMDNVAWYADGRYAFYLIVFIIIWTQIGFYTVLYLSGLQSISDDIYEAAKIDGANKVQVFFKITAPLLKPTTFLVLFMGVIATLQIFEQPYVVSTTGGALPGSPSESTLTMVMYLYTQAFTYFDMGYASAAAFIIFIMIFTLTLVQYWYFEKRERS